MKPTNKFPTSYVTAFLALSLCAHAADVAKPVKPTCCAQALPPGPISDTSLYQLDSTWTTDKGTEIKLASFIGRPQVITMFFANCTYACPILAHDMQKLEAALPDDIKAKVGFVLVTFDAERDTPDLLAKYRRTRSIPESWTLLTAQPDDILELSQLLGIKFKKDARGQFSHSNVITILNAKGEIVFQQNGLNQPPSEGLSILKQLLRKEDPQETETGSSDLQGVTIPGR
jgi:protein SCO1